MNIDYVIFDKITGGPVRWGSCQPIDLQHQNVSENERLLLTNRLDLAGCKEVIWGEVKAIRDELVNGGAETPAGAVDTDAVARSNIAGAALGAVIAKNADAPYSRVWTLQDNSTATLDADAMIAVGIAVINHVDGLHAHARGLRAAINAAADMAAMLAIDINAGWPSNP